MTSFLLINEQILCVFSLRFASWQFDLIMYMKCSELFSCSVPQSIIRRSRRMLGAKNDKDILHTFRCRKKEEINMRRGDFTINRTLSKCLLASKEHVKSIFFVHLLISWSKMRQRFESKPLPDKQSSYTSIQWEGILMLIWNTVVIIIM